jgi:hypothetical protein
MIAQILGSYGAISAIATVTFLIFGWGQGRDAA